MASPYLRMSIDTPIDDLKDLLDEGNGKDDDEGGSKSDVEGKQINWVTLLTEYKC